MSTNLDFRFYDTNSILSFGFTPHGCSFGGRDRDRDRGERKREREKERASEREREKERQRDRETERRPVLHV